ncbi:hypothetical protein F2Q70_00038005 [Brassica cretica]|uniref:Uncharacterized protein n=1 Tax=Brassica cretica TaxID=69181 RepID=A0A8S9KA11_BRACR|nr:hypothetical protein F2Q70_00038005 [Brassica cretica]
MAHIDPIFPNSTTFSSVSHLFSPVELDPLRIFQVSVCYDRWRSWTISFSWGYAVQIESRHLFLWDVLRTQKTFRTWINYGGLARVYTFNTRDVHPDPRQRPVTFFMEHVSSSPGDGTIKSVYSLPELHLKAPRRQCCDILPTSSHGGKVLEIGIRECKEDEFIYIHP